YQQYYQQPFPEDVWQNAVQEREGEVYAVKEGDTLWDICKVFFNDGHFWPKLWSINDYITNPHLINPGDEIRFFAGTAEQAPAVKILSPLTGEEEDTIAAAETPVEVEEEIPEIPPSSVEYKPVLDTLPSSLPEKKFTAEGYDESGMSIEIAQKDYSGEVDIDLYNYITEQVPEKAGEIVEIEAGGEKASMFHKNALVKINASESSVNTYHIINNVGKLKNTVDNTKGYIMEVQGELKINTK
ncbi:MAG: LysM peptidoglycan-binding domain-containing protein, partial [bacterium]|nr:LysM peptidoglycan-binding domain-containing protein [bacterium]